MKLNSLFMLCLAMCFAMTLSAQKGKTKNAKYIKSDITEVISLSLKTDFEKIFGKYDMSQYFDYSGTQVKPQKGYKIVYSRNAKRFILTDNQYEVKEYETDKITSQDGTVDLTNASITCAGCFGEGIMSCNPAVTATGGSQVSVGCSNPCEYCTIYVDIKTDQVAQFQTPEGDFGF